MKKILFNAQGILVFLVIFIFLICSYAYALPDLRINDTNITVRINQRGEGENITLNISVENVGNTTATDAAVKWKHNNEDIGNATITLDSNTTTTLNASFIAFIGNNSFQILLDYNNTITEDNESNNNATITLNISSYQTFSGKVTESFAVGFGRFTLFEYGAKKLRNVLVVDSDSSVDFSSLQALGRNTTGENASNDFIEADSLMNMTGFNDSLDVIVADGPRMKQNRTYTILGSDITNVPTFNNTVLSANVTGILWDTSDDTDGTFDLSEHEDLIFVAEIVSENYELVFPALLRNFTGPGETVTFFLD